MTPEQADEVRTRLRGILKERGVTPAALSKKIGKSKDYIRDFLEQRKESLGAAEVARVAKELNVGIGSLIAPGTVFREGEPNAEFEPRTRPERAFGIPEFEIIAGAAYGGGMDDSQWNVPGEEGSSVSGHMPVAMWNLPPSFVETEMGLHSGFADIIKIRGDSMDDGTARSLAANDRVFIDRRDRDPRQGGIFAVWDGDGVIVKQVEIVRGSEPAQVICKSLNKDYDPFHLVLDGNVHIIGRVAGKITRL